jgi:outer membrane protein OmpA-like peptidoglycan-associated protein
MKKLSFILGCLIAIPTSYALADAPPKGPDFDAHMPAHGVNDDLTASQAKKPILPTDDIVFNNDSVALMPEAATALDNVSKWMKDHPKYKLVLEGHASSVGKKAHNEELASERAMNVRNHLVHRGIAPDRIVSVIYGEVGAQTPVNPNDRRVILFASNAPTQRIVSGSLDDEHAIYATWTKDGALISERRLPNRVVDKNAISWR